MELPRSGCNRTDSDMNLLRQICFILSAKVRYRYFAGAAGTFFFAWSWQLYSGKQQL
jgi:hypothetical protein